MSYKDRQEIVFPRQGVILFAGQWKDKAVSSGSGKSSLIHALTFALGICDLPATTLKNWYSKKLFVNLTLYNDETGEEIEIIRDPKLQLIENGNPYSGLSVGAEDRLAQILKANSDLVKALTHRPQREKGYFINSTDSEIKTFLSTLLSLSKVEDAGDASSKTHGELKNCIELTARDIGNVKETSKMLEVSTEERVSALEAFCSAESRYQQYMDGDQRAIAANAEISHLNSQVVAARTEIQNKISHIKSKELDAIKVIDIKVSALRA
jgi:predicted thioesterase